MATTKKSNLARKIFEIEHTSATTALMLLSSEEIMADGDLFDVLSEHIGRNICSWYDQARKNADDGLAEDLAEIAEDVYEYDLKARDRYAAEISAWRDRPENAGLDNLATEAARDSDGNLYQAGRFDGMADAITAALSWTVPEGDTPSDLKEAVYRAYNVAW